MFEFDNIKKNTGVSPVTYAFTNIKMIVYLVRKLFIKLKNKILSCKIIKNLCMFELNNIKKKIPALVL